MKNIKYLFVAMGLLISVSCGKNFGDINTDPNNPSQVPVEFLITSAEKAMADDIWDEWLNARFGLLVSQYWAQNNYTDESRWNFRTGVINSYWGYYYSRSLRDLQEIITLNDSGSAAGTAKAKNQNAVASILKVYIFHHLTDTWGPIPYSEALLGSENRAPKYDSQKDVYMGLDRDLQNAIADIDESEDSFGSADVIYGGDMSLWKKFANSMRMRIGMRMSDIEPVMAQSIVEAAAAGAFTSTADNAYFSYLSGQPNNNPLNQDRIERGNADFCLSDVLIDKTLKPLNDPRLEIFADEKVNGGGYFGRPFGQTSATAAGEAPEDYSQPSGAQAVAGAVNFQTMDVLASTAPMILMQYSEVCFILAEAHERTWNVPGSAEEWYNAGIAASMNEWGITDDAAINDYLAQMDVAYSTAPGDWKQKIGVQKWLALFMEGVQGWSEWRRLDFTKLEAPVEGSLFDTGNSPAPVRLTYPTNEQTQNASGYSTGVSALGGPDKLSTRLWWDVQ
ncbi:MAG: SusD/RagB family nutrient-binding outer membrane lipoprotein [Lewinellaceae bacterium]|nr:SusD/RagB family nutrient-binding outer membrane lipoprotein [Lewinellaceae bacterium]